MDGWRVTSSFGFLDLVLRGFGTFSEILRKYDLHNYLLPYSTKNSWCQSKPAVSEFDLYMLPVARFIAFYYDNHDLILDLKQVSSHHVHRLEFMKLVIRRGAWIYDRNHIWQAEISIYLLLYLIFKSFFRPTHCNSHTTICFSSLKNWMSYSIILIFFVW